MPPTLTDDPLGTPDATVRRTFCGVPLPLCSVLAVLSAILSFAFNHQFISHCRFSEIFAMNDVQSIVAGYHRSPALAQALTAYWHAPWIQSDIHVLRPVSGFQYWLETYVGLHAGFIWDAWLGYVLFVVCVWLCGMIAYRFTDSVPLAVGGVVMAAGVKFYNACQPDLWLAWYPMHQDLLMMVFLLGTILAFDYWLTTGRSGVLGTMWALFVIGCLTKENVFAFPFVATSLTLTRAGGSGARRKPALIHSALTALFVFALLVIRRLMYAQPREPHFRRAVLLHKPAMFMYSNLAIDVITYNFFPVLLGALIVGLAWGAWHVRQRRIDLGVWGRIFFVTPAVIGLVLLVAWITTGSADVALWQLVDTSIERDKVVLDVMLLSTIALVVVNWKRHAVAAAWLLLFWSYLPVISFIGWHYAFPGGLFRAIYWPVLAQAALANFGWDLRTQAWPWIGRIRSSPAVASPSPVAADAV
ncbi:MAG: hypothetical protein P4L33_20075 [Capsulimonadaceae bacterium]|nr:hypothetical protein [Capsulimonadaceae bacterium]